MVNSKRLRRFGWGKSDWNCWWLTLTLRSQPAGRHSFRFSQIFQLNRFRFCLFLPLFFLDRPEICCSLIDPHNLNLKNNHSEFVARFLPLKSETS